MVKNAGSGLEPNDLFYFQLISHLDLDPDP